MKMRNLMGQIYFKFKLVFDAIFKRSKHFLILNGRRVNLPTIDGAEIAVDELDSTWLATIIELLETRFANNEYMIDVGANLGQSLLKAKGVLPNIHYIGFEPNISCAYFCNELIMLNNYQNCKVYNFGLADENNLCKLEKNYQFDRSASLDNKLRPGFFNEGEDCLAIKFDEFFGQLNKISLIKIDVEGFELEVITGIREIINRDKPIIVCEVLDSHSGEVKKYTQNKANLLGDILSKLDYKIMRIVRNEADELIKLTPLKNIKIDQWTQKSFQTNDYIFYPAKDDGFINSVLNLFDKTEQ